MTVNEIVLSKLKLSTTNNDIDLAIEEIGQKIYNFCNIPFTEELPKELNFTYANMVVGLVSYSSPNILQKDITNIKMGDTSYTFDLASKQKFIDNLILNYEDDLTKYRKIRR